MDQKSKDRLLHKQRTRALKILVEKEGDYKPLPIDYAIDDECRRVLKLPSRPANSPPYVGWMISKPKPSKTPSKTSDEGVSLIKRWEGCRTNAYLCPANVWTIGYGHTGNVKPGDMVSHLDAEELLKKDLVRFEQAVTRYVRVPLTQNQFDALVSFSFNVGTEALRKSTLVRYLNQGKYKTAALQLHRWVHAGGRKLPGLIRRREDEYKMFMGQ